MPIIRDYNDKSMYMHFDATTTNLLTIISVPRSRLQGPDLLLLEAGAVGIYLEAEGLGGEVAVARVDEPDGPPASLLVLSDDVSCAVHVAVAVAVHIFVCEKKERW